MRVTQRGSAAGVKPWIPVNRLANTFNVGLDGQVSSGGTLTYACQMTSDNIYEQLTASATRSTTTATVTRTNHGLSTGDWVMLSGFGAPFDGEYAVASVVDANNFTVTVANSGLTAGVGNLQIGRVVESGMTGKSADFATSLTVPVTAVRLNVSAYTNGFVDLTITQGNG